MKPISSVCYLRIADTRHSPKYALKATDIIIIQDDISNSVVGAFFSTVIDSAGCEEECGDGVVICSMFIWVWCVVQWYPMV